VSTLLTPRHKKEGWIVKDCANNRWANNNTEQLCLNVRVISSKALMKKDGYKKISISAPFG